MKKRKIGLEQKVIYVMDIVIVLSVIMALAIWFYSGRNMPIIIRVFVYVLGIVLILYGLFDHRVFPNIFVNVSIFDKNIEAKLGRRKYNFNISEINNISIISRYKFFNNKEIKELFLVISKKDNMAQLSKIKHSQVNEDYIVFSLSFLDVLKELMPYLKNYNKKILNIEKYWDTYSESGQLLLSSLLERGTTNEDKRNL